MTALASATGCYRGSPTLAQTLFFLLLGWALGLASPIILDSLRRRRENKEVRAALKIELGELHYRLAMVAYTIQTRLGKFNRETLNWFRPIVLNYKGVNPIDGLLGTIDRLLELSDAQIHQLAQAQAGKSVPESALVLKKYSAPLLESKFAILSSLDTELQNRLLEVRVYLSLFNEDVDQARYYFQLTFSGNTSEGNYDRAVQNLLECNKSAASKAQIIVDHISKIVW